ncbi:hypothetical protein AK830_g478 [Neonectria ditissima]|uniref:Extracellular membrane protein CFEM domain-containing protein n=1 Tax=Neonectria ditissima TaxID=78410 RepID=A0A0P7BY35_9HYPO|nr:hypothetical protein AK830_g478 [Neonectria ditissima]
MKAAILSSVVAAGSVAAQLTVGPGLLNIAAIDVDDPEYTTCSVVADYVAGCVTSLGGSDALATADPNEILGCACCVDNTAIYPLYSACSSYLSDEGGPSYVDSYSAYGDLYSICGMSAACSADSGATSTEETSTAEETSTEETSEETTSTEATSTEETSDSTITGTAEQTYATACEDMIGLFTSCTNKIDDFTDLPFREQASCYCCRTRNGQLTWTDQLDEFATTCRDWAKTGEPETAYSVAKTFATFCENFSDVCEDATLTSEPASATDSATAQATDSASEGLGDMGDAVTVTVQPTAADTSAAATTTSDNAGASLRVACGAVLAAVAAMAIAL